MCKNISDCLFSVYNSVNLPRREEVSLIRLRFEDDTNSYVAHIYRKSAGLGGNNRTGGTLEKNSCTMELIKLTSLSSFTDTNVMSLRKFHSLESTGVNYFRGRSFREIKKSRNF